MKPLGSPKRRKEGIIKLDIRGISCDDVQ